MMKETYTTPECELVLFDNEDVITTSIQALGDEIKLPDIQF